MSLPLRIAQWWKPIQEAAGCWGLDPYLLAAIMDRESNGGLTLDPPGPTGTGDHGHGRGLMQIDDRAHLNFIERELPDGSPAWQDPGHNIDMGATILANSLGRFSTSSDIPDAEMAAIAAYNAGDHHAAAALEALTKPIEVGAELRALDSITTGGNYVSDVLERRGRFLQTTPSPIPIEEI